MGGREGGRAGGREGKLDALEYRMADAASRRRSELRADDQMALTSWKIALPPTFAHGLAAQGADPHEAATGAAGVHQTGAVAQRNGLENLARHVNLEDISYQSKTHARTHIHTALPSDIVPTHHPESSSASNARHCFILANRSL